MINYDHDRHHDHDHDHHDHHDHDDDHHHHAIKMSTSTMTTTNVNVHRILYNILSGSFHSSSKRPYNISSVSLHCARQVDKAAWHGRVETCLFDSLGWRSLKHVRDGRFSLQILVTGFLTMYDNNLWLVFLVDCIFGWNCSLCLKLWRAHFTVLYVLLYIDPPA